MAKVWKSGDRVGFHCPGCEYSHAIDVTKWKWNGDYDRPTITPSILVNGNTSDDRLIRCHSFVTDGRIQFLSDCQHNLAGTIVDIPEDD